MGKQGWAVTVSIGSFSTASTGLTVDELVKHADNLMYEAKLKGKNEVRFSEEVKEMDKRDTVSP